MKVHNFSAGPAILPQSVFQEAAQAVLDFNGMGLSLLEISHRSKEFVAVMDEAVALVHKLLDLPKAYSVVFLQGGASTQFAMIPFNLMQEDGFAAYLDTGTWSSKAIKEAKLFGDVKIIGSSKNKNFNYIPKDYKVPENASYFHITTNNTISGTQMLTIPNSSVPLIADMSSEIFSRKIDYSKFDMIYAGAQKNMGPAGTTLVIVKNEILGKTNRQIPTMLNYKTHIDKGSMFNTPPVFAIYVSMLNLRWLDKMGGIQVIEAKNKEKAKMLYQEIDRNSLFQAAVPNPDDRSQMNVTFVLKDESLNEKFLEAATKANISGIKGHRSVGGFRASIYNAMEIESVNALVYLMQNFEKQMS